MTEADADELRFTFKKKNDVWVCVGPCSVKFFGEAKIPLDGRRYDCGGIVILKNGQEYRASFTIDTTTFDFLDKDSVYINVEDLWYRWDEPELSLKLNVKKEEIVPFTWLPDRPLAFGDNGPYPMDFHSKNE